MLLASYAYSFHRSNLHLRIDDPVQILFSLVRAVGPTLHPPEKPGMPLDAFLGPFRCFLSLAILDLGLLVRGRLVVPSNDGFYRVVPQALRLALALLLNGPAGWRGMLCARGVEEEILLVGLFMLGRRLSIREMSPT